MEIVSGAGHRRAGLGLPLQAGNDIEGLADSHRGLAVGTAHFAHHRGAAMDADPDRQLAAFIESVDRRQDIERGGHRLAGIVVVGLGPAEAKEDPVSAVALDFAPVTSGHRDRLMLVGLNQIAVFLCIGGRRELGRADQVAEDHSDGAQLGPEGDTHRFGQPADALLILNSGPARRAEAGAVGQPFRARLAIPDHEPIDSDKGGCDRAGSRFGDSRQWAGLTSCGTRSIRVSCSCRTTLG